MYVSRTRNILQPISILACIVLLPFLTLGQYMPHSTYIPTPLQALSSSVDLANSSAPFLVNYVDKELAVSAIIN